jgi:hypothetical protein
MGFKQFIAALLLAGTVTPATPAEPWDPRTQQQTLMYFVSIPLDAASPREREPVFGLVMKGQRERQFVYLDTRMLNFIDGGITAKFLIAGAVAVGAAMAVSGGGGGSSGASAPAAPAPAKPAASTTTTTTTTTSSSTSSGTSGSSTGSTTPPAPCPPTPCPPR